MELISRLESELRRDVDLIDLFALSGTILKQVSIKGRVLIQSKPGMLAGLVQRMIYNQADRMPYFSQSKCPFFPSLPPCEKLLLPALKLLH